MVWYWYKSATPQRRRRAKRLISAQLSNEDYASTSSKQTVNRGCACSRIFVLIIFPPFINLVENYFWCVPAQLILDIFTFIPSNHIIHLPLQIQRRLTDLASPCVGLCRLLIKVFVNTWLRIYDSHKNRSWRVGDTRQSSSPSLWRCAYLACSHETHAKPFYACSFGKVPIFGLNFGQEYNSN